MAARENQTYLIATIVFVLLALAFLLAAVLGINKANEYADTSEKYRTDLEFEKKLGQAQKIESDILKAYIGGLGPTVAEVDTRIDSLNSLTRGLDATQSDSIKNIQEGVTRIKEIYEKDQLANVASDDEDQPQEFTWRSLIGNLSAVLGKKHGELNIKSIQALDAQRDAENKIAVMQNTMAELEKALATTQNDLSSEKTKNSQTQRKLTDALEESRSKAEQVAGEYDNFKQSSKAKQNVLDNAIAGLTDENVLLKNKINVYEKEVFDRPDGQVVKVSPSIQSVFLDLGRDDGLTVNRTFAIYDQSVTNFEKGRHKAMIEVIQVSDRQSQARVTDEDPLNPILNGDFALTATWDPGFRVPIALAGKFDLDNDGFDDTDKLVQMIERNGGDVVARHDAEGDVSGKIDSDTRYLVLGEAPSVGPDAKPAVVSAMNELEKQADRNTVQVIGLNKLLNRMGVRSQPRIERLDGGISGGFQRRSSINDVN